MTDSSQGTCSPTLLLKRGDLRHRLTRKLFNTPNTDLTREVHKLRGVVTTLQKKLEEVAPTIFTNQTHLDPSDLRLRLTSSRTRRKNSASIRNVVQERNESLSRYLGRFNAATLEINNLDESVKYTAFMRGLRPTSKFAFAVNKSPPGSMSALLDKANKYIQAEEYLETHKEHRGDNGQEQDKRA
ncbi:hypothetical protein RJ639_030275 [Escallonia herrerae]|uniref:Retrotransposon gag domain-containing protein n=1 Tax=Escallonia herrerae TaxID=1293975 RepID=A0AA88XGM9_9ASTE|nr:hypothetical protein RJ639_030275 [Escallonia herrerae]